jgi:hypothetical protein
MPPSSLTLEYDALLSTTLFNYHRTLVDNISKVNALMHMLMKREGGYKRVSDIGDRMQVPLMYELGQADSYSGYDVLDVTPMDGITSAFWEWRQASVPISISALEEKKNKGEARILSLLEAKTKQAEMGLHEFFNKRLLVGAGGSSIITAYTSPTNGSQFLDPLALLIKLDPTTSTTVGNIPQGTHSWWRNQLHDAVSSVSTFKSFLRELRKLRVRCGRGPGGMPDLHLTDENVYSFYETALAEAHRNPSYQKADIPFDNILFYGAPVTYDELVPNVKDGAETVDETDGTWFMINSKFFGIQVESTTDFAPTPFQKPENQDAKTAHILWLGGIGVSNRRKHGVMADIDTTISS